MPGQMFIFPAPGTWLGHTPRSAIVGFLTLWENPAVCSASPGLGGAVLDHLLWSSPVLLVSAADDFILGADSSF